MALKLRIVSEHRRALGSRASVVFGVSGGSIGRSSDNDWVLPDPSRFVSGRHARVMLREGVWYLEDTSTNGTFINDSDAPIGRQGAVELNNGDMLRFGEYHVVVAIDVAGDFSLDRSASMQINGTARSAAMNLAPQVQGHLDASLNASALFRSETGAADPLALAGNAFGQAVVLPFTNRAPATNHTSSEDSEIIAARRMERLARAVRERELLNGGSSSGNTDMARSGFDAFCKGAGLDSSALPPDAATSMLQLAGRLLREALVGLKDVDVTRAELRHQFRLGDARGDKDQPFHIEGGTDELLTSLLSAHDSRRLDPVQWLRQVCEQTKKHEEGLGWASRAGFTEFMRQLDPKELETRFAASGKRGLLGGTNHWELYNEFYRSLMEAPADGGVPHTYGESFANAYRAVVKPR